MLDERIRALLRELNPWWEGKTVLPPTYRRFCFRKMQKYLPTKQAIALVGLRRVGKTVLMRQAIQALLEKTPPKNVFYFLFDEFGAKKPEVLEELLEHYLKTIAQDGRKYLFLDEIQKVPHWHDIVKRFYDTQDDLKFILSGSSSLKIKKSKESLAGRVFDIHVPILMFREFAGMLGLPIERIEQGHLKRFYEENLHKKQVYESLLEAYVYRGAFPELVEQEDEVIIHDYIKNSVIEKIIYEDLPEVFPIRRKDLLFSIMEYCSRETSNLLDITSLGQGLGADYQTTRAYLFYLQNSFVLDLAYNYSRNASKLLNRNKKVHIAHPAFSIAIMRYPKEIVESENLLGKFVETIVFQHARQANDNAFFWRSPQKEEVDIVLLEKPLLPIEVKYRKTITGSDCSALFKFMGKERLKEGLLITRGRMDEVKREGMRITMVPAWLYLLSV